MTRLKLVITAKDDVMLLPRILQVVSRRGYKLTELSSQPVDGQLQRYSCQFEGDAKWQQALPQLIAKLADVEEVHNA